MFNCLYCGNFLSKSSFKERCIKNRRLLHFQIVSGSMEDSLSIGDFIVIKDEDEYNVGNIVTYRDNDDLVITKGDANNTEDLPISRNDIVGKFLFKSSILTIVSRYKYLFIFFIVGVCIINIVFNPKELEKVEEEVLEII